MASAVAFAAASVVSATVSAPANASTASGYTFVPVRLTCYDIEDWWPDWQDEIYMYYGGVQYGASTWNGAVNEDLPAVGFTGSTMRIDMWEWDRGRNNNWLGTVDVSATDLYLEKSVDFLRPGDYHYRLIYKVVPS